MHQAGFPEHQVPVPALVAIAQVIAVVQAAELARQQAVLPVREHHRAVAVEGIQDLHVIDIRPSLVGPTRRHQPLELGLVRPQQDEEARQLPLLRHQPVRPEHGDRGVGKQEELVQLLQDGDVAVDVQDPLVLHLAPVEEFREAAHPAPIPSSSSSSFFFLLGDLRYRLGD